MGNYVVGDIVAAPGKVAYGCLVAAILASGTKVEIPVILVNGAKPGPVLYVEAACHGIELNGIEVLRQVLSQVKPDTLSGTIVAIPNANPVGLDHHMRQTYYDVGDINRIWPGKKDGNIAQRMAYTLWENAAKYANAIIDLHTGCVDMMTHAVYFKGDECSRTLAQVFGTEVLVQEEADDKWKEKRFAGKLRNVATNAGIPSITPELGGQRRFDPDSINVGVRGVLNVMKYLKMVEGEPELTPQVTVRNAHLTTAHANTGGLFVTEVHAGDLVEKGNVLGRLINSRTLEVEETIESPITGLVLLVWDDPVMHSGSMVAMLGEIIKA